MRRLSDSEKKWLEAKCTINLRKWQIRQGRFIIYYSVQDDHTLRPYDTSLDMGAVIKELVVQDVTVISSGLCNDTLEDYFKKITGGEGID